MCTHRIYVILKPSTTSIFYRDKFQELVTCSFKELIDYETVVLICLETLLCNKKIKSKLSSVWIQSYENVLTCLIEEGEIGKSHFIQIDIAERYLISRNFIHVLPLFESSRYHHFSCMDYFFQ